MRSVFDIIGPIMIGPSSSHTAGAVRIGNLVRSILDCDVTEANILLHGSFAATGTGHGTDRALVAGLLGITPADRQVPEGLKLAEQRGVAISFGEILLADAHPNSVVIEAKGKNGQVRVQAASSGGGSVEINRIDAYQVAFSGEYDALITIHLDEPGIVAKVSNLLAQHGINIAFMRLSRHEKGETALMIIETDQHLGEAVMQQIRLIPDLQKAIAVPKVEVM
jgi:L-serine dehydratase